MIDTIQIFTILIPGIFAFVLGIATTPIYTKYFYKYKLWRRYSRTESAKVLALLPDNDDSETRTPRVGGVIVWMTILIVVMILGLWTSIFPSVAGAQMNLFSVHETAAPLVLLLFGALIGLADDLLQIYVPTRLKGDPVFLRYFKALFVTMVALLSGIFLYKVLDINYIHVPFGADIFLGLLFVPVFAIVGLAVFSSSVIDGIDGLSGGVLAVIFSAYSAICMIKGLPDLAALCAVVAGAVLAFLWFNIPPARFYIGETGMIPLTLLIAYVAFMTDTVLLLPIIAFPLFITSVSVVLQISTRKMFGQKFFKMAPLHHHFMALGWSKYKVVMRYWVVAIISSIIGTILAITS